MKPCPALPGLKPCREPLGFPMDPILRAECGTMPSPTGLTAPSVAVGWQKEQCQPQAVLPLQGLRTTRHDSFAVMLWMSSVAPGGFLGATAHV